MSMASRAIVSSFCEEQRTQSHPQYLSGLSRALFPTTYLEIAVHKTSQLKWRIQGRAPGALAPPIFGPNRAPRPLSQGPDPRLGGKILLVWRKHTHLTNKGKKNKPSGWQVILNLFPCAGGRWRGTTENRSSQITGIRAEICVNAALFWKTTAVHG